MTIEMLNSIKTKNISNVRGLRYCRMKLFHVVCSQGWSDFVWYHLWVTHVFCNQRLSGHAAQLVSMLCYSTTK